MTRQIQHDDRCAFCGHAAEQHSKVMSGVLCRYSESGVSTRGVSGLPWSRHCPCRQFMVLKPGEKTVAEQDAENEDRKRDEWSGRVAGRYPEMFSEARLDWLRERGLIPAKESPDAE